MPAFAAAGKTALGKARLVRLSWARPVWTVLAWAELSRAVVLPRAGVINRALNEACLSFAAIIVNRLSKAGLGQLFELGWTRQAWLG